MTLPTQTSPDTVTPCETNNYYFAEQLKRYTVQMMAIFSELHVRVGASATQDPRLIRVPVIAGSKDRVVAWIKSQQTQNKPLRLPAMSVFMRNIALAPELRKGVGQTRRQTAALNDGKPFPENIAVIKQLMPVPYRANFEVSVFASNQLQHQQIMEQIMILFDPQIQIQTSNDPFDWTQITTVTLNNIQWEENFPTGADRRIVQSVLYFDVPVYLSGPADYRENYVQSIKVRLAVVPTATDFGNSYDVLQALDAENAEYIDLFTFSDIDIEDS